MSLSKSMVRFPRKRERSSNQKQRGYFSIWSRQESDFLRKKILGHFLTDIEMRSMDTTPLNEKIDSYSLLTALPEVNYDGSLSDVVRLSAAKALFSKDEDLQSPIQKEDVALDSFIKSESSCQLVNDSIRDGSLSRLMSGDVGRILLYAQRKIASILGPCPSLEDLDLTFGPGASTSCRKRTSARWKLSTPPSISASSLKILPDLRAALPMYFNSHKEVRIQRGELEFVPKSFKTHRSICIEPTVNGMVQRGIGLFMKRKLLQSSINLYDQTINKNRARWGSLSGSFATIDLERASDSVPYLLVMELLPIDWFQLLDSVRTPVVQYRKQNLVFELEKFSSMGNGFTFELESLLFYSLAYGIAQHFNIPLDLTVYGDDIVCTTELALRIREIFPLFGFSVNQEKSYLVGPFRESCGGDFINGIDVRPYYVRGRFTYHRVVSFYNFLMRKEWFDPDRKIRDILLAAIPARFQLFGPDGYGDGHLISDDPVLTLKPSKRKAGYSGFTFETFVQKPLRVMDECFGDTLLPFYSVSVKGQDGSLLGSSEPSDHFVVRSNQPNGHRKVRVYVLGL
jgi:hypothetical protein